MDRQFSADTIVSADPVSDNPPRRTHGVSPALARLAGWLWSGVWGRGHRDEREGRSSEDPRNPWVNPWGWV